MEPSHKISAALTYSSSAIQEGTLAENLISAKQMQVKTDSIHVDHTIGRLHTVGNLDHNLHKLQRILEKTNFLRYNKQPSIFDLTEGQPAIYLKMLHHVTFGASNAFVKLLTSKGVNKDF